MHMHRAWSVSPWVSAHFALQNWGVAKWRTLRFGRVLWQTSTYITELTNMTADDGCCRQKRLPLVKETMDLVSNNGLLPLRPSQPPSSPSKNRGNVQVEYHFFSPKDVPQWPSYYLRSWSFVKQLINHACNEQFFGWNI